MNNLARIRARKGMTQEELGFIANLTKQRICSFETGSLTAQSALKCATALKENVFNVMGSDVLKIIPKTKEDKENLLKIINDIEVE